MSTGRKYKVGEKTVDPFITLAEFGRRIGKSRSTISEYVRLKIIKAEYMPAGENGGTRLLGIRESEAARFVRYQEGE